MRLIIGGTFQGKYEYAKKTYPKAVILNNLHEKIQADVQKEVSQGKPNRDSEYWVNLQNDLENKWIEQMKYRIGTEPELCIVCDEVGMGIVPMEKWERIYREVVGHICIFLAQEAVSVERIVCGIPERIKG